MTSLWSRYKSWQKRDRRPTWNRFTLLLNDSGLQRFNANRTRYWLLFWDDVDAIETYKIDMFTFDQICLGFHTSTGWHEVQEEDDGFQALMDFLQSRFPSIPEDWYWVVMHPAFETNARTLWTADSEEHQGDTTKPAG